MNVLILTCEGVDSPNDVANDGSRAFNSTDDNTVVNYSIMLYYTPEVQANVADLDGFFDLVLAETNQGDILFEVIINIITFIQDTNRAVSLSV